MANLGDLDRGRALVDEALEVATQGNTMAVPIVTASVAEVQLRTGDIETAAATIGEGTIVPLPGPIHFAAEAHVELLRGRIALLRGDAAAALANANAMTEWLARIGIEPFLPEALLLKGDALRASGAATEAEAVLREARSMASHLGFAILWRIDAALSELAAQRGDASVASELAAEARATIDRVAVSLDDEDLRRSFLAVPEVQAVTKGGTLAP
jgi:tetratricopeptide (TPR) repeat protein